MLTLELKDGEKLRGSRFSLPAKCGVSGRRAAGETRELRLDKITSFSHPEIGTVVVSES